MKHGFQFLVGEIDFDSSGQSGGDLYGKEDERAAFQRGDEIRGTKTSTKDVNSSYPGLPNNAGSLKQMTPQQVKEYEAKAQKNGLIYNHTWKNY